MNVKLKRLRHELNMPIEYIDLNIGTDAILCSTPEQNSTLNGCILQQGFNNNIHLL